MLSILTTLLILTAMTACVGFIAVYQTHAPWRSSAVGQTMMMLAVSVVILCTSGLVYTFLGPNHPVFPWVRLATYASLNVAWWRQLFLLIKIQRNTADVVIPDVEVITPVEVVPPVGDQDKAPTA